MTSASDTPPAQPPPALPDGPFVGRETFRNRLRQAFDAAAEQGWRELVLCDADFADWPLAERAVVETLTRWMLGGRRHCLMLASDFRKLQTDAPLFVRWRQQWSHRIACRALAADDAAGVPGLFYSPAWVLRRQDVPRSAGFCSTDAAACVALGETLRDLHARSAAGAFPANVLGL